MDWITYFFHIHLFGLAGELIEGPSCEILGETLEFLSYLVSHDFVSFQSDVKFMKCNKLFLFCILKFLLPVLNFSLQLRCELHPQHEIRLQQAKLCIQLLELIFLTGNYVLVVIEVILNLV